MTVMTTRATARQQESEGQLAKLLEMMEQQQVRQKQLATEYRQQHTHQKQLATEYC